MKGLFNTARMAAIYYDYSPIVENENDCRSAIILIFDEEEVPLA